MHENVSKMFGKISKIRLKELVFILQFCIQSQNVVQVVGNFAQACACVTAAFRNYFENTLFFVAFSQGQ